MGSGAAGATSNASWKAETVMTRDAGQRVFLVIGSPWLTAISAIRNENSDEDPWKAEGLFSPGDLLVTVLDTDPRAVLCVERLEEGGPEDAPVVLGERWMATGLPPVPEIEARAPALFPELPGPIPARDADRLLTAIAVVNGYLQHFEPCGTGHGALGEAWVRLNAVPACLLCDESVDPGDPTTGVYVGDVEEAGKDVDGLLCPECSDEMERSRYATLVEHRLATRHPQCPRCAAFQTLFVALGKLQLPPDVAPRWPWEIATGDVFGGDETRWHCRACGYGWEYVFSDLIQAGLEHRQREIVPLWDRNLDNRIVLARKRAGSDSFQPVSVLCAPLEPHDVMRMLAEIVQSTFAGSWTAALDVITDRSFSAWEFLDHSVNEFSESIGDRARDVSYRGNPQHVSVPGVGIKTDYGHYINDAETGVGYGSGDFYDVAYGYLIDDAGNVNVLAAQTETEVVENGKTMTQEEEVWTLLYSFTPSDYSG